MDTESRERYLAANHEMSDQNRVKKALMALTLKRHGSKAHGKNQSKFYDTSHQATKLFCEYAEEITAAVIEEALLLAKHRDAEIIDSDDICFILGRKYYLC